MDDYMDDFYMDDDDDLAEYENDYEKGSKESDSIHNKFLKVLEGHLDNSEKVFLKQLYVLYLRFEKLNNYDEEEKKLYNNMNDYDKILFETERINKFLRGKRDKRVSSSLNLIKNLVSNNRNMDDRLYASIYEEIIRLELKLGMQIGLYKEVCSLFKEKVINYYDGTLEKSSKVIRVRGDNK